MGKCWGAMTEWLLSGSHLGDLSLMAYVPAVYSPAGPSQTLEMPSQVCSVMVSAMCGLGRP